MVACACGPSYSGGWGRRIAWTQEAEVAVWQDHTTTLQLVWQGKTLPQKKGGGWEVINKYGYKNKNKYILLKTWLGNFKYSANGFSKVINTIYQKL